MEFMPNVKGNFECDDINQWPVTLGVNSKGVMDEKEYLKLVLYFIIPFFWYVEDVSGKYVMIKIGSGPGRLPHDLLGTFELISVYEYPGFPNTIAVTQETDQNYRHLKSTFWSNLSFVTQQQPNTNQPSNIQANLIGLLFFRWTDPVSNTNSGTVHLKMSSWKRNALQCGKRLEKIKSSQ